MPGGVLGGPESVDDGGGGDDIVWFDVSDTCYLNSMSLWETQQSGRRVDVDQRSSNDSDHMLASSRLYLVKIFFGAASDGISAYFRSTNRCLRITYKPSTTIAKHSGFDVLLVQITYLAVIKPRVDYF